MAQKNDNTKKPELENKSVKEAVKAEIGKKAKEAAKAKSKVKEYKVKEGNFKDKRNYYIDGENVLLEVGKIVTEEIRNKFHTKFQELYFEEV